MGAGARGHALRGHPRAVADVARRLRPRRRAEHPDRRPRPRHDQPREPVDVRRAARRHPRQRPAVDRRPDRQPGRMVCAGRRRRSRLRRRLRRRPHQPGCERPDHAAGVELRRRRGRRCRAPQPRRRRCGPDRVADRRHHARRPQHRCGPAVVAAARPDAGPAVLPAGHRRRAGSARQRDARRARGRRAAERARPDRHDARERGVVDTRPRRHPDRQPADPVPVVATGRRRCVAAR